MKKITVAADAYIGQYGDPKNPNVTNLMYVKTGDDASYWVKSGYSLIGRATITLEMVSDKEMIANKVQAIKQEIQKTRADSEVKVNKLLDQISKLQAIEFSGDFSSAVPNNEDSDIPF